MRNLRDNIRKYTEPVTITIFTEAVVEGIPVVGLPETYELFGNVWKDKSQRNIANNSTAPQNDITIEIPLNTEMKDSMVCGRDVMYIRNNKYSIISMNEYNINSESFIIVAREVKNG